jgi:hypothetical protein
VQVNEAETRIRWTYNRISFPTSLLYQQLLQKGLKSLKRTRI